MKRQLLIFFVLLLVQKIINAQVVNGYVTDAMTGEPLIGVNVLMTAEGIGVATNTYGFFSLSLGTNSTELQISYIGYETQKTTITTTKDTTLQIQLIEQQFDLETITVTPDDPKPKASREVVSLGTLDKIPALMSEADVLKAIQLMPGVQFGNEGSSGLHVRGGSPDQNLILLDGVPVYNAAHLFGFFSVFNTDALKKVELIKGGFPARYGGRLSSVLDIALKDGDKYNWNGKASVGLLSSKVMVEGPIKEETSSILLTARTTYYNLLIQPTVNLLGGNIPSYGFWDATAKWNHTFSTKDKLFFSLYGGQDNYLDRDRTKTSANGVQLDNINTFQINWGNVTSALRWNHVLGSKSFSDLTLLYSQYGFGMGTENESISTFEDNSTETQIDAIAYNSNIRDWGLRWNVDYFLNPNHQIKLGAYSTWHQFKPSFVQAQKSLDNIDDSAFNNSNINALESAVYVEDDMRITKNITANIGLHFAGYLVENVFYPSVQPRAAFVWSLPKQWNIQSSFAVMQQPIHLLSNTGAGLPTDLWVSSTATIEPQEAHQVSLGLFKDWENWSASIEGYYKKMDKLIEYAEGINFLDDGPETDLVNAGQDPWEERIEVGEGEAYGVEFSLQKTKGKTSGWLAYTLAFSNRLFENLNAGQEFPYRYDRRHDFSVVVTHEWRKNIDFGFSWVFNTGAALTLPTFSYAPHPSTLSGGSVGSIINGYENRNAFRMPNYHRLDASINFHKEKPYGRRTWSFSVYNMYNQANPFFIYLSNNTITKTTLFPVLPSFSWKVDFAFKNKK